MQHKIVSKDKWLSARKEFLLKEKQFTKQRDELSRQRRQLPYCKIDKAYVFDGATGKKSLSDLFEEKSQLIVYHFMYGPDWEEGCPSCSFFVDNFDGIKVHLAHRDTNLVVIAKAPYKTLSAYRSRMGWSLDWYSANSTDFNEDFKVTFSPQEVENKQIVYNYRQGGFNGEQAPGVSVFLKGENGEIFHTYSCFARGLDMLNGAYQFLDITAKGRDEAELPFTMAWLRRHDQYED